MPMLDGLEDAGRIVGRQERATQKLITDFMEGREPNAIADFICESMVSLAQNIDVQNAKGREISRNMTSLLGYVQQLQSIYEDSTGDGDDELAELVEDSRA